MTKSSADGSGTGKMSKIFTERSSVKSTKLVQDWVNSSPTGNMASVANEPSLHFSGSFAQSNQAIVQHPSSTQPLNSHSNLNTLGQFEANINLHVHEPHEPRSRINLTNIAHAANNIIQGPQNTPPSPPINFGIPTKLNAPNTARQLSQATMHLIKQTLSKARTEDNTNSVVKTRLPQELLRLLHKLRALKGQLIIGTVKKHWVKPTLLDFNDRLKEKAEAHN